jgi:hypothetical protein
MERVPDYVSERQDDDWTKAKWFSPLKWRREIGLFGLWYCNLVLVIHPPLTCLDKATAETSKYFGTVLTSVPERYLRTRR